MPNTTITLTQARTLLDESETLLHALYKLNQVQTRITLAAVPYKSRWAREFARLQQIVRVIGKAHNRQERRRNLVYKFYI